MKKLFILLVLPLLLCAACASRPPAEEPIELLIAAAASLLYAAEDLTELYQEAAPHVKLTYSFGGSGALQTQIEEGAPADIFFSAAQKQMNELEEKGYLLAGSRRNLLENRVVLIVPQGGGEGIASFADVAGDTVSIIALGEPGSVPVGQYAEEIFTNLGLLDAIKKKTVNYGSDVTQVLTWTEAGEVDCGVVYATDAATSDKITVVCAAPDGSVSPVIYPVAVLEQTQQAGEAQAFIEFLSSAAATAVFEKYGFTVL